MSTEAARGAAVGRPAFALACALILAACGNAAGDDHDAFPAPHRPVASLDDDRLSTEEARDRIREADTVMDGAGISPGMTVADIGAGEGYYTIRLAKRVGENGRVLAQDIVPEIRDRLAERVTRQELDNVSVRLGEGDDPKLPPASFDRILMIHMYHEIEQPYAFLWHMRPALKPDGQVVVVDADRPTSAHGTPPGLLACEFAALGFRLVKFVEIPGSGAYQATFATNGGRPEPTAIRPCMIQ